MVDPIFTYVAGIAFLVLIIVPVLYLMANTPDYEDDSPGESVVGGVGPVASEPSDEEPAAEPAETEETTDETTEEEFEDAEPQERDEDA